MTCVPGYCFSVPVFPIYGSCTMATVIFLSLAVWRSSAVASFDLGRFAWKMRSCAPSPGRVPSCGPALGETDPLLVFSAVLCKHIRPLRRPCVPREKVQAQDDILGNFVLSFYSAREVWRLILSPAAHIYFGL